MTDLYPAVAPCVQRAESIVWSNYLVNSPAVYGLLEKRVLYYLTLQIKQRFVERGLSTPDTWQSLYFYLTDADLGTIGGKTHVLQTYEALSEIGKKFMEVQYYNEKKELIRGKVHWVDAFSYNTVTKQYEVRMSPEVMPYLINLAKGFTKFSAQTALSLRSKYSQKMYELCCEYSGNFRYPRANTADKAFRKNVLPMYVDSLRYLFDLCDHKDERTGKILTKGKYPNYKDIRRNVILPAQRELYQLYHEGKSEVWFDCVPYQRVGRKITAILFFIYTKDNPKQGLPKIWEESDEPLNPYEDFSQATLRSMPIQESNLDNGIGVDDLLQKVEAKLSNYLERIEVDYYMEYLATCRSYDNYQQILQVIEAKERQPKFKSGTQAFKRTSIMHYALAENLKTYGWSIPSPNKRKYTTRCV